MPWTRAELKVELEGEAARLIHEVLAWSEQAEAPTCSAVKPVTLKSTNAAFSTKPTAKPACPSALGWSKVPASNSHPPGESGHVLEPFGDRAHVACSCRRDEPQLRCLVATRLRTAPQL